MQYPTTGQAGCYRPLTGPSAGSWARHPSPPGEVVGTVLARITSTTSAVPSASTALLSTSTSASAELGQSVCAIGEAPCGTGCMFVGDECCPSGLGSCRLGDKCIVKDDGSEGCCPAWANCEGVVSEESEDGAASTSSTVTGSTALVGVQSATVFSSSEMPGSSGLPITTSQAVSASAPTTSLVVRFSSSALTSSTTSSMGEANGATRNGHPGGVVEVFVIEVIGLVARMLAQLLVQD